MIKIVLVDDHIMLRTGLADLLKSKGFSVLYQASNGKEFMDMIEYSPLPNVVLMDINMPVMDGFVTTEWVCNNYPEIKVLALSMYDTETNIVKMLCAGARGYVLKYADIEDLVTAINTIAQSGFYYSDLVNYKLVNAAVGEAKKKAQTKQATEDTNKFFLNDKEVVFLKHCCTELSYKEIAAKMSLSPKTIDNYREQLFAKLNTHTRIGLVMYAIKNEFVKL